MRNTVYIYTDKFEKTRYFYTKELKLFEQTFDYGMNTVILSYIHSPSFCLTLKEKPSCSKNNGPIFSIEVKNCEEIYKKIKNTYFKQGGLAPEYEKNIFEYPIGKNFLVIDPVGNEFLIVENY